MLYQDLPDRWKQRLSQYLKSLGRDRTVLFSDDFPSGERLHLTFEDHSHLIFYRALMIEAPEIGPVGNEGEIAVFTEHCGYHLFSMEGLKWYAEPYTK